MTPPTRDAVDPTLPLQRRAYYCDADLQITWDQLRVKATRPGIPLAQIATSYTHRPGLMPLGLLGVLLIALRLVWGYALPWAATSALLVAGVLALYGAFGLKTLKVVLTDGRRATVVAGDGAAVGRVARALECALVARQLAAVGRVVDEAPPGEGGSWP